MLNDWDPLSNQINKITTIIETTERETIRRTIAKSKINKMRTNTCLKNEGPQKINFHFDNPMINHSTSN